MLRQTILRSWLELGCADNQWNFHHLVKDCAGVGREPVFIERLAVIAGEHDNRVVPHSFALQIFEELGDLRIHIRQAVGIDVFDNCGFVLRKMREPDGEVELCRTESTRKITGHHVRKMATLKIQTEKKRFPLYPFDPLDRFRYSVTIIHTARVFGLPCPLRKSSISLHHIGWPLKVRRMKETIDIAGLKKVNHSAPKFV